MIPLHEVVELPEGGCLSSASRLLPGAEVRAFTDAEQKILSFLGVGGVAAGLAAKSFDRAEEVSLLIDIARTSEKDATRVSAMRHLDKIVREAAELDGLLAVQHVAVRSKDGTGRLAQRQTRLITSIQESMSDALQSQFSPGSRHLAAADLKPPAPSPAAQSAEAVRDFARDRIGPESAAAFPGPGPGADGEGADGRGEQEVPSDPGGEGSR